MTIRTDCQALISFFNKTAQNKPSRVRWMAFVDYVTGSGVEVTFEHIEGKDNHLADSLSRLISILVAEWPDEINLEQLSLVAGAIQELKIKPNHSKETHLKQMIQYLAASWPNTKQNSSPLTKDFAQESPWISMITPTENYEESRKQRPNKPSKIYSNTGTFMPSNWRNQHPSTSN